MLATFVKLGDYYERVCSNEALRLDGTAPKLGSGSGVKVTVS
jgi:hypothetical protein